MPENKEIKILREYFLKREDVEMAFVFGSRAKGENGKISDWDIAIYAKTGLIEWEEQKEYPESENIWSDVTDLLKTDAVDLVVLNKAPLNIAWAVLKDGLPLVIRNEKLFWEIFLLSSRGASDYQEFVDDYYHIYETARSLSKEAKERLKKAILFAEEEMALYGYFAKFSYADYSELHKRHDIERWAENLVNSAIDIGEVILASAKKKAPDYYREIFLMLTAMEGFGDIDAVQFSEWVRLRNVLAHEYLDIKWARLEKFVKESKVCFEALLEAVKKLV